MLAPHSTPLAGALCTSTNVTRVAPDLAHLAYAPCVLAAEHHGRCLDEAGSRWTRLGELLRQRGLRLAGSRVQAVR